MSKQYGLDIQSQQDTYIRPIKDGGFYRVEDVQPLVDALEAIANNPITYDIKVLEDVATAALKEFRDETT